MKTKTFAVGLLAIGAMALSGCQTTRSYSLSTWEDQPLDDAIVNLPEASNIPVTKLEQQDRNNGSVKHERWTLDCGKGFVFVEHASTAWFSSSTEAMMKDADQFGKNYKEKGDTVSNVHEVTNSFGKVIGHYGNLLMSDSGRLCQIAEFSRRLRNGRTVYDNDRGAADTVVNLLYCGKKELDIPTLTAQLKLVENDTAYANYRLAHPAKACAGDTKSTSTSSRQSAPATKLDQSGSESVMVAMEWNNVLENTEVKADLTYAPGKGTLSFAGRDKAACTGTYHVNDDSNLHKGTWKLSCANHDTVSGKYAVYAGDFFLATGRDDSGNPINFSFSF